MGTTTIDTDAAKLATLLIDLLQKVYSGQVTLDQLRWFSRLTREEREQFCIGAYTITPVSVTRRVNRLLPQ